MVEVYLWFCPRPGGVRDFYIVGNLLGLGDGVIVEYKLITFKVQVYARGLRNGN